MPWPWDSGVYKRGRIYPKGALVTYNGSIYSAQADTAATPGQPEPASRAWRLAVKSGRDGTPGKNGKDGGE